MFDVKQVDWNQAWKEGRVKSAIFRQDQQSWNDRAPSYAKVASESRYAEKILDIMKPLPHWHVLDMACGGGTLAVPLARHVEMITAVDFSNPMLAILNRRCQDNGINNIRTIQGQWDDDWEALGIGSHDVAIASRCLVSEDLRGSLLKLDRIARERVYIVTTVADGPYDRRMFEAIGRPLANRPDFIYPYNLLYQMGILAQVNFIDNHVNKAFTSPEEVFDSVCWMFDRLSGREEELLKSYVQGNLVCRDGKWALAYEHVTRWAVLWWVKRVDG